MTSPAPTLGTLLRLLIDELDGAVERSYRDLGLDFRPRFTAITRLLAEGGPLRITQIAARAGLSQPAVSQTIGEMRRLGLIDALRGPDGRERIVRLSNQAEAMLPLLVEQWERTARAADSLRSEIGFDLTEVATAALEALRRRPFGERMEDPRSPAAGPRTGG